MEDRKSRFHETQDLRPKLAEVLQKLTKNATLFGGVHVFTPHGDIPDDAALRLAILSPECFYSRAETRLAFDAVLDYVRNNGAKPRYRGNRLLFLAADHDLLARVRDCLRTALAWKSIVDDVHAGRLNIDLIQKKQAEKELETAESVLPKAARECYRWLLCPSQNSPTATQATVEAFPLNTSGGTPGAELERVCTDNELIISTWSPIHLRNRLKELYWKDAKTTVGAMAFWEDTLRYVYLPRLKTRAVLEQAIIKGAGTRDFFGTAYGEHEGQFDGFKLGDSNVQLDDTLLLIEPDAARKYDEANKERSGPTTPQGPGSVPPSPTPPGPFPPGPTPPGAPAPGVPKAKAFHGHVAINASTAKMRLVQVAEEIIAALAADPNADVKVSVEIQASFPNGAKDETKRAVSENAKTLGFKNADWE